MTGILLALVGVLYLGVAISYYIQGNIGMAIAFAAYSIANYGLWMAGR